MVRGSSSSRFWGSTPRYYVVDLVGHRDYEGMQFLIDRGIDMTIRDYRWGSTAEGWAYYANKDLKMAQWLADAERERGNAKRAEESPPE